MADMQNGSSKIGCYGVYEDPRISRSTAVLTEDMVRTLARKYDVTPFFHLRSAGVITTQEFSAGYGGTLPLASISVANSLEMMPLGDSRTDFAELLKQYAEFCGECLKASVGSGLERDHSKSLLSTYSRLYMLFMQVHSVRLELYSERGGPG